MATQTTITAAQNTATGPSYELSADLVAHVKHRRDILALVSTDEDLKATLETNANDQNVISKKQYQQMVASLGITHPNWEEANWGDAIKLLNISIARKLLAEARTAIENGPVSTSMSYKNTLNEARRKVTISLALREIVGNYPDVDSQTELIVTQQYLSNLGLLSKNDVNGANNELKTFIHRSLEQIASSDNIKLNNDNNPINKTVKQNIVKIANETSKRLLEVLENAGRIAPPPPSQKKGGNAQKRINRSTSRDINPSNYDNIKDHFNKIRTGFTQTLNNDMQTIISNASQRGQQLEPQEVRRQALVKANVNQRNTIIRDLNSNKISHHELGLTIGALFTANGIMNPVYFSALVRSIDPKAFNTEGFRKGLNLAAEIAWKEKDHYPDSWVKTFADSGKLENSVAVRGVMISSIRKIVRTPATRTIIISDPINPGTQSPPPAPPWRNPDTTTGKILHGAPPGSPTEDLPTGTKNSPGIVDEFLKENPELGDFGPGQ